ncbi:MAG TPA: SMC-Scp complex subunit ScpB [Gemmataceae bacterium]|nr:SMC-Scp complex subunit ScpB [Gemmataceae bacterium]
MIEEHREAEETTSAEDLGRSYGTILDQQNWDVDNLESPVPPAPAVPAEQTREVPPDPLRIIEALLFVGGPPLSAVRAAEIIRSLTPAQFLQAIDTLNRAYRDQGRPYAIVPQGQGYVLTLRPRFRSVIDKLYGGVREARLSTVALDVLSLVAYRQPASKQEIDSLRGAESGPLLRQLVRRGLITVVQRAEAATREVLYGTTPRFLELFDLRSLDDLPRTQDVQQI